VIAFVADASYAPVLIFLNKRFRTAIQATGAGCTGISVSRLAE
jgi:hypothetical protein